MSAYQLAKIRAKLARMLREEELAALSREGREALLDRLRETPYGPYLGQGEPGEGLRRGYLADVAPFFLSLHGRDKSLLDAVLAHWRVENLKLIIRTKIRDVPPRR